MISLREPIIHGGKRLRILAEPPALLTTLNLQHLSIVPIFLGTLYPPGMPNSVQPQEPCPSCFVFNLGIT